MPLVLRQRVTIAETNYTFVAKCSTQKEAELFCESYYDNLASESSLLIAEVFIPRAKKHPYKPSIYKETL